MQMVYIVVLIGIRREALTLNEVFYTVQEQTFT